MKEGDEDEVRLKMKMEVREGEACLITSVDGESEIKLARTARIGSGRQWQWQWQLIELGSYVRSTWSRRGVAHWQARWDGKSDCGWWGLESTADGQRHSKLGMWLSVRRKSCQLNNHGESIIDQRACSRF